MRGQQFWLGPARIGQLMRFWIACGLIHLSVSDLGMLPSQGATPVGQRPQPSSLEPDSVVEVEGAVSRRTWPRAAQEIHRHAPSPQDFRYPSVPGRTLSRVGTLPAQGRRKMGTP